MCLGRKLEEGLKDVTVCRKCGWESNRHEEGEKKTRKYSKSCIRNVKTDSVQCEAGSVSHFGCCACFSKPPYLSDLVV